MNENPAVAALEEEIRIRELELTHLRGALEVLKSDRQPVVHVAVGSKGQLAISNVFVHPNGHGAVELAVEEPPTERPSAASRRARTASILGFFDRKTARTIQDVAAEVGISSSRIAAGALTHRGYLKKKGDGYVRTAKEFIP
jgi:hypothetical protein